MKKLCISPNGGACPDYVFEPDYQLRTIEELEAYVTTEKHLPNIPSAKEIEAKGHVDYIEMTYGLLEKVEELTLYTIEQNKVNKAQQDLIEALQRQLAALNTEK